MIRRPGRQLSAGKIGTFDPRLRRSASGTIMEMSIAEIDRVVHVAASVFAAHALSIFGDHSDVLAWERG